MTLFRIAGWTFDRQGSYTSIWLIFASLALIGLIAVFTTPRVKPKD